MTSEKYPSGKVVTNSFDANGRLSGLADASRTYMSGLAYQGNGGSVSAMNFWNRTSQTFAINDRFQMINQTLSKGSDAVGNRLQRDSSVNLVPNQTSIYDEPLEVKFNFTAPVKIHLLNQLPSFV